MRNTDSSPTQFWGLSELEKPWVEVQPYLERRGYRLRRRYRQGWTPSWAEDASIAQIVGAEDFIKMHPGGDTLDAVRISDDKDVLIKRAPSNTPEIAIGLFFSSDELRSNPANHCVPILDTFPDPRSCDFTFVVMPVLRRWHDPQFRTIGELIDFVDQLLEGVQFMHGHNVAHRDIASSNIMMDGTSMYPDGFHPDEQNLARDYPTHQLAKALTRTQAPPKYYFIDFGISTQFADQPSRSLVRGEEGRTRAPELSSKIPYDPFAVDIFGVGEFLLGAAEGLRGVEFLLPLARAMVQRNPSFRPTAEQALREFRQIRQALPRRKLSSLLFHRDAGVFLRFGATVYDMVGFPGLVAIALAAGLVAFRFRFPSVQT